MVQFNNNKKKNSLDFSTFVKIQKIDLSASIHTNTHSVGIPKRESNTHFHSKMNTGTGRVVNWVDWIVLLKSVVKKPIIPNCICHVIYLRVLGKGGGYSNG